MSSVVTSDSSTSDDIIKNAIEESWKRNKQVTNEAKKSVPLPTFDMIQSKDTTMIDGSVYTAFISNGFNLISSEVNMLNKINVFPLPDNDTGNNIKMGLLTGTRNLLLVQEPSLANAARNMAADTLLTGQGNSGTILSHFFISLSKALSGKDTMTIDEFAQAVASVSEVMDQAMPNAVEGTMVSTIRDGCKAVTNNIPYNNFHDFLKTWNDATNNAVNATPEQLVVDGKYVLKDNNVVDSGAKGFALLVEGALKAADGTLPSDLLNPFDNNTDTGYQGNVIEHDMAAEKFSYCTEAILKLKDGCTKDTVKDAIVNAVIDTDLGNSLVVIGAPAKDGGDLAKVHIHTSTPQIVFDALEKQSLTNPLLKEKVDDMAIQVARSKIVHDRSKFKFAFVSDTTTMYRGLDMSAIEVIVPIALTLNGNSISLEDVDGYSMLSKQRRGEPGKFGSAAPTPYAFYMGMKDALKVHDEIIVLTCGSLISATFRNASKARDMFPEEIKKNIYMFDSWGYVFSEFPMLNKGIEMAYEGKSCKEVYDALVAMRPNTHYYFQYNVSGVKTLIAHGRVPKEEFSAKVEGKTDSQFQVVLGTFPDMAPLPPHGPALGLKTIHMEEEQTDGTAEAKLRARIIERIRNGLKENQKLTNVIVTHISRIDEAKKIKEIILKELGDKIIGEVDFACENSTYLVGGILAAYGCSMLSYEVIDV